jgi:hypothetical protein
LEAGPAASSRALRAFARGFGLVTGENAPRSAVLALFRPGDRVGIKINTIGGRALSTRPELSLALAGFLSTSGLEEKNIAVWDRTNRELRDAGYRLSA